MGRPKINLTPEQIEQIGKLASVLTLEQIADFLSISDDTLRRRMQEDPNIMRVYKSGKQRAIAGVATNLIQQAREGNITAMIFYLKTQAGWRETQAIEATVTTGEFILDLTGNDEDKG